MKQFCIVSLLLIGLNVSAFCQTYPISISTRLAKPYSIYLSDYVQTGMERLSATLLLRDASEAFYDVRLRVSIKGAGIQLESKPDFAVSAITLQTGVPLTLQNEELAAYLNPQNLIFKGITRQQFGQTGALPEGLYEINWQVYDARRTDVSLSSQAITSAWIVLNNPPIINTPLAAEKLMARDPQNVRFSWQQGGALLNGGFTTAYTLELYEMREAGRNPNEIIRGTKPIATLTSAGTSLNFDASQISLIPGMQYAFRVQARDTQGRSLYKNSGYSEVRTFVYGDACLAPTEVTIHEKSTQWVSLTWQPAATATQYVVRYRQADDPDAQWFEDKSYTTSKRIAGLRPGSSYEYQVKCLCGSFGSEYTTTNTVATIGAEEANLEVACSPTVLPAPILDASTSLPVAVPGSFFKVGHFDMKVTEVTGGAGTFSGKGQIFVPFLATTLKVSFQHIAVNATGQVVEGEVVADVMEEGNLSASTINRINGYQPAFSQICVAYENGYDEDGFDEDGLDREGYDREGYSEEGYNRQGYDREGYSKAGLDQEGYDREGYSKEGYDKNGADREGKDSDGNPVDVGRATGSNGGTGSSGGGAGSNGLSADVKDNALEKAIRKYLNEQKKASKDSITKQRKQVVSLSQLVEEAIADAMEKNIMSTRAIVLGPNDEGLGEGMSLYMQITEEPPLDYPYFNVRKAHKDLYDADVLLQNSLTRQQVIERFQNKTDNVATTVRQQMDTLSEEKATALKDNKDALNEWIHQQVDALVEEDTILPQGESQYYPDESLNLPEGYATLGATFRPTVDQTVNKAFFLNQIIQDENRKRGQYAINEAMNLPVGISKIVGNTEFVIAIGAITFTPVAAYMDVYMGTEMPWSGNWLSFQGQAVEMFPEGFGGETNRLLLADDVPIRLNNNARLTLKASEKHTFVEWDCQGFRQIGVQGEVEFCPGMIRPAMQAIENPGQQVDGQETVKARFETAFTDWGEFIAQISLDPFQVRGLDGFVFEVSQAFVDLSDTYNPTGMAFPQDYRSPYQEAGVAGLWQGFYLKEAKVTLPEKLAATAGKKQPKDLYIQHMIIDDQGVSGIFSATNVIPDGNLGGWGYSVDRLSLHLVKNQLKGAEMTGNMQLPIMEDTLGYQARVQPGGNWLFAMSLHDTHQIPLWAADVSLQQGSSVIVTEQEDKFSAMAVLHGTVDINTTLLQNSVVQLSGIGFQNLVVSTEAPHFQPGTWSLGEAGTGNKAAGFELTLTDVQVQQGDNEVALQMGAKLDLMDGVIVGNTGLLITGKQETDLESGRRRWKHQSTTLNKIGLKMKGNAIDLNGELYLFDGHQVYGKGFKGRVSATFARKITVDAQALFGRVNGFRYWYADALVRAGEIPVAGTGLSIYGFGGGAYKHLRRERVDAVNLGADNTPTDEFATPSGIRYVPDAAAGLGVKAAVVFGTSGNAKPFNGDVGFEIAFQKGGGISKFGFEGNGYFMSDLAVGKPRLDASLYAGVDISYDFQNQQLHGTCNVYASLAGGLLRGRNSNNLAGQAVIHFDPKDWYIHIGRPSSRIGLILTTPIKALPIKVDMGAYLMAGTQIEAMPLPPEEVSSSIDYQADRKPGDLLSGKGFAFGADFSIHTGKMQVAVFYGELKAGAGFDMMLMDHENMICAGGGKPGINGWYAEGQAYAYLEGAIGIKVTVFRIKIEQEILRVGAGALLEAKLPNPFWMRGNVNGYYSLLGGRVKGRCDFGFELGEQCQWQASDNPEETSMVDGLAVISALTPKQGKQDIDVFAAPQAVFNLPIDEPFTLADTLKGQQQQFKLVLDEFKVLDNGQPIQGSYQWNERRDVVAFDPHEILPGEKELTIVARVKFQEKRGNQWSAVRIDGKEATEEMTHTFTTAAAPTNIPENNVEYSYPVNRQLHFLPQESKDGGYVQLKTGQDYLFTADTKWRQTGRLTPVAGGQAQEFSFSYSTQDKRLTLELPTDLKAEHIYKLEIVKLPAQAASSVDDNISQATRMESQGGQEVTIQTNQATGELERLQEAVLYTSYFRTSKYKTFAAKYAALAFVNDWQWAVKGLPGVQDMGRTVAGDELFDAFEAKGTTEMQPLVMIAAGQHTPWHQSINRLVYDNAAPKYAGLSIQWHDGTRPAHLSMPPINALLLDQVAQGLQLSDAMISSGLATSSSGKVAYVYQLPFYMYYDYYYLQQAAANSTQDTEGIRYLLDTPFLPMTKGQYPVYVGYRLPGKDEANSLQHFMINKP